MGTVKFYENKLDRHLAGLASLAEDPPHPTILASRAQPGRRPRLRSAAEIEVRKKQLLQKTTAKKQKIAAQQRAANTAQKVKEQKMREYADPVLRQQNERLLKHIKLLENMLRRQADEIAALKS